MTSLRSAPPAPVTPRTAARARPRHRHTLVWTRLSVIVLVALVWWIGSMRTESVASPSSTVATLVSGLVSDGWLRSPLADTLKAVLTGFVIAVAVGVPLGLFIGGSRRLGRVVDPLFSGLFAIPRVVLYPVILAAVGVGLNAKIWMALLSAVLPVAINTSAGIRNTSPTLIKLGRSVGCGPVRMLRHIYLPSATPAIMIGVRIGLSIAFISVIVAELFAATNGLGLVIQSSYGLQQYSRMFAVVLLVTLLAFVINLALWSLERRLRASID